MFSKDFQLGYSVDIDLPFGRRAKTFFARRPLAPELCEESVASAERRALLDHHNNKGGRLRLKILLKMKLKILTYRYPHFLLLAIFFSVALFCLYFDSRMVWAFGNI